MLDLGGGGGGFCWGFRKQAGPAEWNGGERERPYRFTMRESEHITVVPRQFAGHFCRRPPTWDLASKCRSWARGCERGALRPA